MRNEYGELIYSTPATQAALVMAAQAASKGKIPAAANNLKWVRVNARIGNKKIGTATYHEVYDVLGERKALICVRQVEGTKYGQKTVSKDYYLLTKHGRGVKVAAAPKAIAAKAALAKPDLLGYAIAVCEGQERLAVPAVQKRTGYKAVCLDDSGELVSVWDGSPWPLGKTRTEAATPDHRGGFYYYPTLDACLNAAGQSEIFGKHHDCHRLVVVAVEASGKEFEHGNGKLCASRLRPLEIVCMTL